MLLEIFKVRKFLRILASILNERVAKQFAVFYVVHWSIYGLPGGDLRPHPLKLRTEHCAHERIIFGLNCRDKLLIMTVELNTGYVPEFSKFTISLKGLQQHSHSMVIVGVLE